MKLYYLIFVLLLVPLVNAVPEIPHQFYGSVKYDNGVSVSSGWVDTMICSQYFSAPIINGYYGLSEPLLVSREDCSVSTIEFYVNSGLIRTYNYIPGGYTQLNFVISAPYVPLINPPADDNPVIDNNQNIQTNDENDEDSNGRESRIRPPPEDLVFDKKNDKIEQNLPQENTAGITGKAVYDFLTETKVGIATASIGIAVIVLGLVYLIGIVLL